MRGLLGVLLAAPTVTVFFATRLWFDARGGHPLAQRGASGAFAKAVLSGSVEERVTC